MDQTAVLLAQGVELRLQALEAGAEVIVAVAPLAGQILDGLAETIGQLVRVRPIGLLERQRRLLAEALAVAAPALEMTRAHRQGQILQDRFELVACGLDQLQRDLLRQRFHGNLA